MKKLLFLSMVLWTSITCAQSDPALRDSIARRVKLDQKAAGLPPDGVDFNDPKWQSFKDSVFLSNYTWAKKVVAEKGFPGFDKVGEQGSKNFWLLVQHSDKWADFQQQVLALMEIEVKKKNAHPQDFAYLTDRFLLNTGKKQVYGTQVTYNLTTCQAIPRSLEDPEHVNERRKAVGLGLLEVYLNTMSTSHFEMNRADYEKKGIKQAKLYEVPKG